tara:strand:+ start:43134 stop:43880 length:747 start_codon:yes stop_codon:yes gene_type:complete
MIVYLHIGIHKTGSTSVQDFLSEKRTDLAQSGIAFYQGSIIDSNHIELYLSALDDNRDSLALLSLDIGPLDALRRRTKQEVADFLAQTTADQVIFSSEGLSLLRSPSEMTKLYEMLDASNHTVKVVCVLRDKTEYLQAYKGQILKVPGRKLSKDPGSSLYAEPDSWLADFDSLVDAYGRAFGRENVETIDFDSIMAKSSDILPEVLRKLNVSPSLIPAAGVQKRSNKSSLLNRTKQSIYKVISAVRAR